jgi:aquaporin Z
MTSAPYWLDELSVSNAVVAKPRMLDTYAVEALGTFGLVLTVGVGLASRIPFAALGIGAVLMALIYAGGHRIGAHFNAAITLAAACGAEFRSARRPRTGWLSWPPDCVQRS